MGIDFKNIDLKSMDESKRKEVEMMLKSIENKKKYLWITNFSFYRKMKDWRQLKVGMQEDLFESIKAREKKFNLYQWGNGSGKSAIGAYVTVLLALWLQTHKYNLPYIWACQRIWIGTKSGKNVQEVIEPYLLWDNSVTRIPPDEIENLHYDNKILKKIYMKNWTEIGILTYDAQAETWQGGNIDFIWMDEEPRDNDILKEALARTRVKGSFMLFTMTPLAGNTPVIELFDEKNLAFVPYTKKFLVSALDNPFADNTFAKGLTEDEYRQRILGLATPSTWLVYNQFNRHLHVIPHIDPKTIKDCRYYRGLDFGTSHPTWVVFLSIDNDNNIYIFDEFYKSNCLLSEIVREVDLKSKWLDIEATIADSASARERLELKNMGISTIRADKHSVGENWQSNRKAGILMVNQLFFDWKIFISDRCKNLIKELENHYYKDWNRDWEVIKLDDDLLDALRYILMFIKKAKVKTNKEKDFKKKFGKSVYEAQFELSTQYDIY